MGHTVPHVPPGVQTVGGFPGGLVAALPRDGLHQRGVGLRLLFLARPQQHPLHRQHHHVEGIAGHAAHHAHHREQRAEEGLVHAVLQAEPLGPAAEIEAVLPHQYRADEQEVHHHADGQRDHHALEIRPREVVDGVVEGVSAGEVQRRAADPLGDGVGCQPQHRQRHGGKAQGDDRQWLAPLLAGLLALLPEDSHVDFRQIRRRQSAGEQEQPLHHRDDGHAAHVGVFHQRLVHQRLAQVPQKARNTRQRTGAAQEQHVQQRLTPAEALDIVQIQRVGVVVHHTGEQEQRQLHQRVVHHVQHRAVGGQRVMLAQQADHGRAHGDKTDLGQGRAGQNVLQIGGEHRQHRAQHHGDSAQHQKQHAPVVVARQHLRRQQQNAEDTGLGQHAAQQRRSRSRSHRVGLGQPDMHREQTRLGGEAEQDAQRGGP